MFFQSGRSMVLREAPTTKLQKWRYEVTAFLWAVKSALNPHNVRGRSSSSDKFWIRHWPFLRTSNPTFPIWSYTLYLYISSDFFLTCCRKLHVKKCISKFARITNCLFLLSFRFHAILCVWWPWNPHRGIHRTAWRMTRKSYHQCISIPGCLYTVLQLFHLFKLRLHNTQLIIRQYAMNDIYDETTETTFFYLDHIRIRLCVRKHVNGVKRCKLL